MDKRLYNIKLISILIRIIVFLFLLIFFLIIFFKSRTFSNIIEANEIDTYSLWNGGASYVQFSGSGTFDDPYLIKNGSDLMYLKILIEGDQSDNYNSKYYELTNNLNMNNIPFESIGTNTRYFKGTFNGNGYAIANLNITAKTVGSTTYSGLFSNIENATLKNINLKSAIINNTNNNSNIYVGLLVANSIGNNTIQNIGIYDSSINVSNNSIIGGVVGNQSSNTSLNGIYVNTSISGNGTVGKLVGNFSGTLRNSVIYTNDTIGPFGSNNQGTVGDIYSYTYNNGATIAKYNSEFNLIIQNSSMLQLASFLTSSINDEYNWYTDREYIRFDNMASIMFYGVQPNSLNVSTPNITEHVSGIEGDTIYINNLESDYKYYYGANYTHSENGALPNGSNQNIYNTNNLVKVYVKYNGTDISDDTKKGYVSLTEQQSNFVYYDYYKIEDGYVYIDLIDNPYTDRPTNSAFNGWVTSYRGAVISYDSNYYTRKAKVPVTYAYNGVANTVVIEFNASFIDANVIELNNSNWDVLSSDLKSSGLKRKGGIIPIYEDTSSYYLKYNASNGQVYPSNSVNESGNSLSGTCNSDSGCSYYVHGTGKYDDSDTYYELSNSSMKVHRVQVIDYQEDSTLKVGSYAFGYFKKVKIKNNSSYASYYDINGNYQYSGTCSNSKGCDYYELLQFYDASGNIQVINNKDEYYYLSTRDTNIIVLKTNVSTSWKISKPFTLTSIHNDIDYRNSSSINVDNISVHCYDDTVIENLKVINSYTHSTTDFIVDNGSDNYKYFYGNWNNVKIGRGIVNGGNSNLNFNAILGGSNGSVGSQSNIVKYKLIVESGIYNSISLSNGNVLETTTGYVEAKGVYGSDYDRILSNNNSLLVYSISAASFGGIFYSSNTTSIGFDTIYKNGQFGKNNNSIDTGIYVGGITGGVHYASRRSKIEGGIFSNITGGAITASNRTNYNDLYLYVTGGDIESIVLGSTLETTYGNRIFQMTSGVVRKSVFGGSNGFNATGDQAILNGNSFMYIGGNSIIGTTENVNNNITYYNAEVGSVFGCGNGKNTSTTIGTCSSSTIIIDGSSTIRRNIYGGGNFVATGVNSQFSSTTTNITVLGGSIGESIYGGANSSGSGSSDKHSTINIMVINGTISGSIYGGSRTNGIVYGDTNVLVYGGSVTNVYGGGKGGYVSSSNPGTYVGGNVNVVIGNRSTSTAPNVTKVYGGSDFGVVNGISKVATLSSYSTSVTINAGVISEVYGGCQGDSNDTPYILGNSIVTINGGTIQSTYGGNDLGGLINGNSQILLYGGFSSNVYGGGNHVASSSSSIVLDGSVVDTIFGGGNNSGLSTSNISLISGSATTVYGGSDKAGIVENSNITSNFVSIEENGSLTFDINVSKRNKEWYETVSHNSYEDITLVINNNTGKNINKWEVSFTTVPSRLNYNYSQSEIFVSSTTYTINQTNRYYGTNSVSANSTYTVSFGLISDYYAEDFKIISSSIVGYDDEGNMYESKMRDVSILNIYGGNNVGGTTLNTNIDLSNANVTNVYGGGNLADITNNTTVKLNNTNIRGSVYGGGNSATVYGNTNVEVNNSVIENSIYGGGNSGNIIGTTDVFVHDSTVKSSIYGGGNSAVVQGGTTVTVGKNTSVLESVFAGGNTGSIGTVNGSGVTNLNIIGGTIEKNVYGGCNTSVVYGTTNVNIAGSVVDLGEKGAIHIKGNIYGGGESNATGGDDYDFSFISVTEGININIDGTSYLDNELILDQSIFGSGNASSSRGISNVNISNIGSMEAPRKIISIQRTNNLVVSNSVLELLGTTDRTNEYSTLKYSLNRIEQLKLKNNATLLLRKNANMLESLSSVLEIDDQEYYQEISIDENGNVDRNVNNRIYLSTDSNLNVTTNEAATTYGTVSGMTFFGMYTPYENGNYFFGIYDKESNSSATGADVILGGSYVLGLHVMNSDVTKDGFYTNYINEDYTKAVSNYITPTPANANYYMWTIGGEAINYSFSLTASKYSSLGTKELSLLDFSSGNTRFEVIGFNSETLEDGIQIIDSKDVPKVAKTLEEANSIFGISMKSETTVWTSLDTTKFLSSNGGEFIGTESYLTDNQLVAPSFTFYLYHAKNISLDGNLGTVSLTLQALTPKNEIEYDVSLINITIEILAHKYDDQNAYDASITYSKKYDMPSATDVNITSNSSFTAYYSLYATGSYFGEIYGNNNDCHRTLSSNYALPIGTTITMIDLGYDKNNPRYFYYTVSSSDYTASVNQLASENEVTYDLNKFISMGSLNSQNTYNDASSTWRYFDYSVNAAIEEFVFIFDFANANINTVQLNNTINLELRTVENRTKISVLGVRQPLMVYNLYEKTNVVLNSTIDMETNYLYYNVLNRINYDVAVGYDQTNNRKSIIDTTYESNSMGINVTFYDSSDNVISSSLLIGTNIKIGDNVYYPSSDGIFRIKLANKVSNLSNILYLTVGSLLPSGSYKIRFDLFSSSDGLHIGDRIDKTDYIPVTVVGNRNGISVELDGNSKIIDGVTGTNLNGTNDLNLNIKTSSVLTNPNIRITLYSRDKDSYNTNKYTEIDLREITTNTLIYPSIASLSSKSTYEYLLASNIIDEINYNLSLKSGLESGTYLLRVMLYDGNQLIDNCDNYLIVKKEVEGF